MKQNFENTPESRLPRAGIYMRLSRWLTCLAVLMATMRYQPGEIGLDFVMLAFFGLLGAADQLTHRVLRPELIEGLWPALFEVIQGEVSRAGTEDTCSEHGAGRMGQSWAFRRQG